MKRRIVVAALVAGLVGGLAPIGGTPAQASDCASPIQLFFWWGVDVSAAGLRNPESGEPINRVTNPISLNAAVAGCIVTDASGVGVNLFYVYPGSTFTSGRDNVAVCIETTGTVSGLGLNITETWKPGGWNEEVDSCGGPTQVGTGGASSPVYALDPTQLGTLNASTAHGSIQYRTIDR